MKSKLIASALFVATATAVVVISPHRTDGAVVVGGLQPPVVDPLIADPIRNERPKVEVVFVLDTTGSMGNLIAAAKEKIWSIASTMSSAQHAPEIKMGLVAYRDRGDAYVTRVVDLSDDLDSMYATLMDFRAGGGGDGPESVNAALYDAIHNVSWSQDDSTYRVVFLVGDAPPHMDYRDDVKYPVTLAAAKRNGIVVNAIQCGNLGHTKKKWQHMAQLGDGRYFQVDQAGSAVAITTPFDRKLAELSARLDDTRLFYGTVEEKKKLQRKREATEKLHAAASLASRARRATFNVSGSGKANLLGNNELVDDVTSGRVDLSTVDQERLPEPMQSMAPTEQQALIKKTAEKRDALKRQIKSLVKQRSTYLEKEIEARGGAKNSLDDKLYDAVREQAAKIGLRYESDAPRY